MILPTRNGRAMAAVIALWAGGAWLCLGGAQVSLPGWDQLPEWAPLAWWSSLPFALMVLACLAISRRVAEAGPDGLDVCWGPWGIGGFHLARGEVHGITLVQLRAGPQLSMQGIDGDDGLWFTSSPGVGLGSPGGLGSLGERWGIEVCAGGRYRSLGGSYTSAFEAKRAATALRRGLGLLDTLAEPSVAQQAEVTPSGWAQAPQPGAEPLEDRV